MKEFEHISFGQIARLFSPFFPKLHICALFEQQLYYGERAAACGMVQRGVKNDMVLNIDPCAVIEEECARCSRVPDPIRDRSRRS